jgi:hypothetical protein
LKYEQSIYLKYEQRIASIIEKDQARCLALEIVESIALPDWLIAAGFVRNAIWDYMYDLKTSLNDIDVIYFCSSDVSIDRDLAIQNALVTLEPNLPWSVKNQARMHLKNGDLAYLSTKDAMQYWPEKQTSIGVKLNDQGKIVIQHCFDLGLQFNGKISRNPARETQIFEQRLKQKSWQSIWPKLEVET